MKMQSIKRTAEVEGNPDEFSRPVHGLTIMFGCYPALKCSAIFNPSALGLILMCSAASHENRFAYLWEVVATLVVELRRRRP